jgi:hypothetical protein
MYEFYYSIMYMHGQSVVLLDIQVLLKCQRKTLHRYASKSSPIHRHNTTK